MTETRTIRDYPKYWVDREKPKYNGVLDMIEYNGAQTATGTAHQLQIINAHKRVLFAHSGTHYAQKWWTSLTPDGFPLQSGITMVRNAISSGIDKDDAYALGVGTYQAEAGEDSVVNIDGLHVLRSNAGGYHIEFYNTDFQALQTLIEVDTVTNDILVSGVSTSTMKLVIGDSTAIYVQDGVITLSGTTFDFAVTDLHVLGNLWVTNTTTLSGATTVENSVQIDTTLDVDGASTLNSTLNVDGRSKLHISGGTRVDTGA